MVVEILKGSWKMDGFFAKFTNWETNGHVVIRNKGERERAREGHLRSYWKDFIFFQTVKGSDYGER